MAKRLTFVWRSFASAALLVLIGACSGSPVIPTSTGGSTAGSTAKGADTPPTVAAPPGTRIFVSPAPLSYPLSAWTLASKYVLHPDGTFELDGPGGSFGGTYKEYADGSIAFGWEGWSRAGPWGSTATIFDDKLTVQYNEVMQLTDFEDAVYTLIG